MNRVILAIGLLIYLLIPALAQMENGTKLTAVGKYHPRVSQTNAQQFLSHILEHINEGTLGGDVPLNMTKEDLQAKFGIKDEEFISATWNTSYFDRNGYRYFLFKNKGKEILLTIGVQFEPLTKEQIYEIFGSKPYLEGKAHHEMVYKLGEYMVMFSNTDPKNRVNYDQIFLSPSTPPK